MGISTPLIVVGILVVALVLWLRRHLSPAQVARRLVQTPRDVPVALELTSSTGEPWYLKLVARCQGDSERALQAALEAVEAAARDRRDVLVESAVFPALRRWAGQQSGDALQQLSRRGPPVDLTQTLEDALSTSSLRLVELRLTMCAVLSEEHRRLLGYWIGGCFQGQPHGAVRVCNALEFYLDGQQGPGQWHAQMVPRGGGAVRTLSSARALEAASDLCFAKSFMGAPHGTVRRLSLNDMKRNK